LFSREPETTPEEFESAVEAAARAFQTWKKTCVLKRQRFALECVVALCGQTSTSCRFHADAQGDVLGPRATRVIESVCAILTMLMGKKLEVSRDMDTETRQVPLGLCSSIAPYNFPALIPLWTQDDPRRARHGQHPLHQAH
ncbi:hypothetical protein K438DRAFT_2161553, partial [Mycena galopus ATCC 62051]